VTSRRSQEPTREILNIDEAAQLLGISTKTFQKVLRDGEVPGRKIGREWKFSRRALIDWVAAGRARDFIGRDSIADDRAQAHIAKASAASHRRPAARALRPDTDMSIEED